MNFIEKIDRWDKFINRIHFQFRLDMCVFDALTFLDGSLYVVISCLNDIKLENAMYVDSNS